jgi:hypothetical protein
MEPEGPWCSEALRTWDHCFLMTFCRASALWPLRWGSCERDGRYQVIVARTRNQNVTPDSTYRSIAVSSATWPMLPVLMSIEVYGAYTENGGIHGLHALYLHITTSDSPIV